MTTKAALTPNLKSQSHYLKRAWIRNDEPPGHPAPGHISCPCGNAPVSWYRPEQGNVICECGTVYTWDGWIVNRRP